MSLDTATQPPTAERPTTETALDALLARLSARGEGPPRRRCRPVVHHARSRTSACARCTSPTAPPACAASRTSADETSALVPRTQRARRDLGRRPRRRGRRAVRRRGPPARRRRRARPAGQPAAHPRRRPPLRVLLRGPAAHRRDRRARGPRPRRTAASACASSTSSPTTPRPSAPATWPASTSARCARSTSRPSSSSCTRRRRGPSWAPTRASTTARPPRPCSSTARCSPASSRTSGASTASWSATGWPPSPSVGAAEGGLDLQMPGPGRPLGRRPARRGPRRRRQRGAARRQGRCASCAWRSASVRSTASSRPGALRDAVGDVDVREVLRRLVVPLDGRAPRRRARAARRARRRHAASRSLGPNAVHPFLQGGGSGVRPARPRVDARGRAARGAFGEARDRRCTPARVSRLLPPALDLAGRCTDPATGHAGALRASCSTPTGPCSRTCRRRPSGTAGCARSRRAAVALRIRTTVRLDEPGRHEVGVGTVGKHVITVGGQVLSTSDDRRRRRGHPRLEREPARPGDARDRRDRADDRRDRRRSSRPSTPSATRASRAPSWCTARPAPRRDELLAVAVEAAAAADLAIVVVGTNEEIESEGYDRTSLALPGTQDQLVKAAARREPAHDRRRQRRRPGAAALARRGAVRRCGRGSAGRSGPRRSPTCSPASPSRPAACPGPCPRTSPDVPVPHAVPVDGVVDYHEGVARRVPLLAALGRTPGRPVRARPRLDHVGVRGRRCRPSTSPTAVVLDVVVRNTGHPRRPRGRPGLRRAARGAARRRRVRCAGSAVSPSCTPTPARPRRPGPGGRHARSGPGTRARPGWVTPAGTLPIARRPLVRRPTLAVDVDRPGHVDLAAPRSPGRQRSAVPRTSTTSSYRSSARRHSVRMRTHSMIAAAAAGLHCSPPPARGGVGSATPPRQRWRRRAASTRS